ncbi:tyrosine-type recombinase/integrase [Poriferisphaera sp. WC338]|uniref:tyrosine-type recombinase/integrase n=1 Tax=Poriferisphaera sp. WC338 TaxID=3425129 RepID=UPI003D819A75
MMLHRLCEVYLEYAKTCYRKPDGGLSNEYHAIAYVLGQLLDVQPDISSEDFGPSLLIKFRDYLETFEYTRQTINDKISRVKRVFRWACEREYVSGKVFMSVNSVAQLRSGRCSAKDNVKVRPAMWRQVRAVVQGSNTMVGRMVRIHYLTGMRINELVNMRWQHIERSDDYAVYTPIYHKTSYLGKPRQIVLGPRVLKLLGAASEGFCFLTKHGRPYDRSSYRREIVRACERKCVEPFTPLQLRHNAAKRFNKHFGIELSRIMLGHSSAFTTEIYIERDLIQLMKAAKKIA